MRRTCRALPFLLVPLLAFGCSSNGGSAAASAATCSFRGTIPSPDSSSFAFSGGSFAYGNASDGTSVQSLAEALGRQYLDTFVGSFLRGTVTLYKGTLSAHDDQSVLGVACNVGGPECSDQSITPGPAVGTLTVASGLATLAVHSLNDHKYVELQQSTTAPEVTTIGLVLPDSTTGGNTASCSGCASSFASAPASISITGLDGTGYVAVSPSADASQGTLNDAGFLVDAYAGVRLDVFASAALSLATPCQIDFNDLIELNSGGPGPTGASSDVPVDFVQSGDLMVAVVQGSAYAYSSTGGCTTSYTIELYVNTTNLADYGVRNYTVVHVDAGYYEPSCP